VDADVEEHGNIYTTAVARPARGERNPERKWHLDVVKERHWPLNGKSATYRTGNDIAPTNMGNKTLSIKGKAMAFRERIAYMAFNDDLPWAKASKKPRRCLRSLKAAASGRSENQQQTLGETI
jgi:hypothetical protein